MAVPGTHPAYPPNRPCLTFPVLPCLQSVISGPVNHFPEKNPVLPIGKTGFLGIGFFGAALYKKPYRRRLPEGRKAGPEGCRFRVFPGDCGESAGPVRFQALKTHGGVTRGIEEAGKMGMIAFYAGLCVGMLLGVLLLSLLAFFLAKPESGALPDPAEGFSQLNPLEP